MDIFGEVFFLFVTSFCSSLPAFLTCTQAFNSRNRDQPNSTEILELSGTIEYETSVKSVRGFRRHSSLWIQGSIYRSPAVTYNKNKKHNFLYCSNNICKTFYQRPPTAGFPLPYLRLMLFFFTWVKKNRRPRFRQGWKVSDTKTLCWVISDTYSHKLHTSDIKQQGRCQSGPDTDRSALCSNISGTYRIITSPDRTDHAIFDRYPNLLACQ